MADKRKKRKAKKLSKGIATFRAYKEAIGPVLYGGRIAEKAEAGIKRKRKQLRKMGIVQKPVPGSKKKPVYVKEEPKPKPRRVIRKKIKRKTKRKRYGM